MGGVTLTDILKLLFGFFICCFGCYRVLKLYMVVEDDEIEEETL